MSFVTTLRRMFLEDKEERVFGLNSPCVWSLQYVASNIAAPDSVSEELA